MSCGISKYSLKEMFGHYHINAQKTIGDIVELALGGGQEDEDRFGVQMDEFKDLIDDEDFFDAGLGEGPEPAIEEELKGHVPYCHIPLDQDDSELDPRTRRTRLKGDKTARKRETPYSEDELASGRLPEVIEYGDEEPVTASRGFKDGKTCFAVNKMAYNMFRPGYTIILYGPRRSGKSKLIKNICQRMRHWFPQVVCFTMTKSSAEYFSYLPYYRVIEGLDEELLEKLFKHQQKLKEAMSRGEDVGNPNLLIILDDCMAEGLRYKKTFNKIFYNGRHVNITLIVAVQDVRGIAPSATINCDVACTFSLPDHRGRDTIREKFADYLTRDEFDNLYDSDQINKKYHIVLFDIAHRYNPLDKRISFGCVNEETEEPFVMGDRSMWAESPSGRKQLEDLGFGYLMDMEDWGIVKPRMCLKKTKQSVVPKLKTPIKDKFLNY